MVLLGDLVGCPYKDRGRSKDGFDCWGLALEVMKRYGKEMKDYLYDEDHSEVCESIVSETPNKELSRPIEPCVVALKVRGEATHCGVYIGGGKIIHCMKDTGVVIEKLKRWENRIYGYYQII